MKLYVVRSLIALWTTVTLYVGLTLLSRSGIDDQLLKEDVFIVHQQRVQPHGSLSAGADPVLAHRHVVAEVRAKHLRQQAPAHPRTGWQRYFRYQMIGDRIWPTATRERDDRILNQLHLTHQEPAGIAYVTCIHV